MIIAGKSAIDEKQLKDRINKGVNNLEIHLNKVDVLDEKSIDKSLEVLKNFMDKVVAIHSPIDSRTTIEGLNNKVYSQILRNTCRLANEVGKIKGEIIHVIFHQELSFKVLEDYNMLENIKIKVEELFYDFKNITINLENLMLYDYSTNSDERIILRGSYYKSTKMLSDYLRKQLKTNRIGLVLDTCHILVSLRMLNNIHKYYNRKEVCIKEVIEYYGDSINIVHLANVRGLGLGTEHGVTFDTQEEKETLLSILETLYNINYDKIITLEVVEENYLDAINMKKTYNQVKDYYKSIEKH